MRKLTSLFLLIMLLVAVPILGQEGQTTPETPTDQTGSIALAPELFDSGSTALDAQDYDRALLDFSLFVLLNPTFSQGYYARALSYMGRQETDNALDDIEQALATVPPDFPEYEAALYGLRATIYSDQERFDDAIADYTQAIDISPNPDLYASRALLYVQAQDYESALPDLDTAIEQVDNDPFLRLYRAFVHTQLGNTDEAAPDYYIFMQLIETRRVVNDPLDEGQPEVVSMTQGVVHQFEIEGEADQVISVFAQGIAGSNVDPLLILLDDDGNVLAANDDYGVGVDSAIIDFQLPENGSYTVLVSHSLGGTDGQVAVGYEVTK